MQTSSYNRGRSDRPSETREGCPRLLGTDWGAIGCLMFLYTKMGFLFTPNMGRIHTPLKWCILL